MNELRITPLVAVVKLRPRYASELCMQMPMAPRSASTFQWARTSGQSRGSRPTANGASIAVAKNQRKNVMAIGGMSLAIPRPMIQLQAQKKGASVSSRYGETLRFAAMAQV